MSATGTNPDGTTRTRLDQLPRVAALTGLGPSGGTAETEKPAEYQLDGWQTPNTMGGGCTSRSGSRKNELLLVGQAKAAGWMTPISEDGEHDTNTPNTGHANKLVFQVGMAGYQTPKLPSGGACERNTPGGELRKLEDQAEMYFRTPEMTGWKLNPAFSLWLMGYPEEWASCGARAMQSCRRSRRRS